jgi:hypothetical protein
MLHQGNLGILILIFVFCGLIELNFALVVHGNNQTFHFRTPAFVRFNNSFSVTAPLVSVRVPEDCNNLEMFRGKILVSSREILNSLCGYDKSKDPIRFAHMHGSVGFIRISTLNPHLMDYTAWKLSPQLSDRDVKNLPAVAITLSSGQKLIQILRNYSDVSFNATIDSNDPNLALDVFECPWVTILFSITSAQSLMNLGVAIWKLSCFIFWSDRSTPRTTSVILWAAILSNASRLLISVNSAFFREEALGWSVYRIILTLSVPLEFASTLAISYRKCWVSPCQFWPYH